jgi:DNA-binding PucR family transcriptional regulator
MKSSAYSWQFTASKWLICLLATGYILALSASFLNALPLVIKLGLATFVLLHSVVTLKRLASETWRLDYDIENGWQILEASTTQSVEILPSTVISKLFIFLHYQTAGKKFYRVIFHDALLPHINDYRQLIVTLKTYH